MDFKQIYKEKIVWIKSKFKIDANQIKNIKYNMYFVISNS